MSPLHGMVDGCTQMLKDLFQQMSNYGRKQVQAHKQQTNKSCYALVFYDTLTFSLIYVLPIVVYLHSNILCASLGLVKFPVNINVHYTFSNV